jgi:hypothetical protein
MNMTRYANDIVVSQTIVALDCAECGVTFGIGDVFERNRRKDHRSFYCPNGHSQGFYGENKAERYERLYKSAEARLTHTRDQRDAAERSKRAYKGQVTKIKRRVGKGVCPCCNRSFQDLASHMEAKHPDYGSEPVTEA